MLMIISGGDLGGTEVEFATGDVGDAVQLDAGPRLARYEVREYVEDGVSFRQAVFVGYVPKP